MNDALTSVGKLFMMYWLRLGVSVVDDLGVVELLHHLPVCLQGFTLWSQVFSNFLYRLVARELFKDPNDVTSKDVDAAEFLN